MAINPTLPEKTADLLRGVIQKTTPAGGVAGDHTS
jgi:hypothetical protein